MSNEADEGFYERADTHIRLSNDQVPQSDRGKVSASMMYATARFNAYISACGSGSKESMKATRAETVEYFVESYRRMFEENFDDYIENFDQYMQRNTD